MEVEKKLAHEIIIDMMEVSINNSLHLSLCSRNELNEDIRHLAIFYTLGNIMKNIIILEEHRESVIGKLHDIQTKINSISWIYYPIKRYSPVGNFLNEIIEKI